MSKSEHTYAAIVEVAMEISAAKGIGKLSLSEVAKCLNISKSGVFSRVGSLTALQIAVLDEFDRQFTEDVFLPAIKHARGLPRLNALVEKWIARMCSNRLTHSCLYIAGSFEYDDADGPVRNRLQQGVEALRMTLNRSICQAVDEGHLRSDTDPSQLVFEIYSMIVGVMHDARFLRDEAETRMRIAYARLISAYTSI